MCYQTLTFLPYFDQLAWEYKHVDTFTKFVKSYLSTFWSLKSPRYIRDLQRCPKWLGVAKRGWHWNKRNTNHTIWLAAFWNQPTFDSPLLEWMIPLIHCSTVNFCLDCLCLVFAKCSHSHSSSVLSKQATVMAKQWLLTLTLNTITQVNKVFNHQRTR